MARKTIEHGTDHLVRSHKGDLTMGNTWDYYDSFSDAVDWASTQAGFCTFPVSIWQCGSGFAVEMDFDGILGQSAIATFYPSNK